MGFQKGKQLMFKKIKETIRAFKKHRVVIPPKDDYSTQFEFFDKCPDCGSEKFYTGPEGGMSRNVMCVRCESAFNAVFSTNIMGRGWAHRISNTYWKGSK